ncbi:MAG: hypothetical protein QOD57_4712 [Actinomycetota bacterium]|jgi:hypothetical protein|nr:hypothetical protein [Actinomycetota bacterium]MDQ1506985.1 hypothetical protein [Actinomycetota bacterium]
MHRPRADELLTGVATALEENVLPALDDLSAQRQLKASVRLLRRVGAAWDRLAPYLVSDNDDVRHTVEGITRGLGYTDLAERLDTTTASPAAENEALHTLLVEVDRRLRVDTRADAPTRSRSRDELSALYRRMLAREADACGTGGD